LGISTVHANTGQGPHIARNTQGVWTGYTATGKILTGQQKIAGNWYQFNSKGAVQYGQIKGSNGKWYLFNRNSGKMMYGLTKDSNGKTHYFNSKSGVMTYGWVTVSSTQQDYFDTKSGARTKTKQVVNVVSYLNSLRATKRKDVVTKGDGNPAGPLVETAALDKWAKTRANELAKANILSHANMSNGEPA
jgi:hypothetical protein